MLNAERSTQQPQSVCTAVINEFQTTGQYSIESQQTALESILQHGECVGTPSMEMCD